MTTETRFSRQRTKDELMPLAFSFEVDPVEPKHQITEVTWTSDALNALKVLEKQFHSRQPKQSLPTQSLRMQISISDVGVRRLDRELGWSSRSIAWTDTSLDDARDHFHSAVMKWIINDLSHSIDSSMERPLQKIRRLANKRQLLHFKRRIVHIYNWSSTRSGTTTPTNRHGYSDLADFVARQIEGKEIFQGLGNMKRIVSRDLKANRATLMTNPIQGQKTLFSLVVTFKVISYPGRNRPVIALECSKRQWLHSINRPIAQRITAFALPNDRHVALEFSLRRQRGRYQDGPDAYAPGDDFAPIARHFGLVLDMPAQEILERGHQIENCPLLVVHKQGIGKPLHTKAGVPDRDKLEAFQQIAHLLAPWGLKPWRKLVEVKTDSRPIKDRNQKWRKKEKIGTWKQEMIGQIASCYGTLHQIVLGYHPNSYRDAQQAENRLKELLGSSIRVQLVPIPSTVHGPQKALPQSSSKPKDRARSRADAWQPFVEQVQRYMHDIQSPIDGVLIVAPEWYKHDGHPMHDDIVNKQTGRITIARQLHVPTQYLLPSCEETDFETRTVMAWLDLAWKTRGRIDIHKLNQIVRDIYGRNLPSQTQAPTRILALSILRHNRNRQLANQRSFVPVAIELDMQKGACLARFVREKTGGGIETTPSKLISQTIIDLALSSPTMLNADWNKRQQISASFFYDVITDFCQRVMNPLIVIDAVTCRSVWPWLSDSKMDTGNIVISDHLHAEADWKNASIIRVRTDNAPKVLLNSKVIGTGLNSDEYMEYTAPKRADAQVFRIDDSISDVYLSFGSLLRTGLIQGVSCFRSIETLKSNGDKPRTFRIEKRVPFTSTWSTPSGVEFTAVRTMPEEDPEQLIRLVERLRNLYLHAGDWTTMPAPLFFTDVLKEYIADYNEEEDTEGFGRRT